MLQAYGFMLENNKFNAMNFSAVIDFGQKLGETKEKKDEDEVAEGQDDGRLHDRLGSTFVV